MNSATQPVSVADLDDIVYRAITHYRAHLKAQFDSIERPGLFDPADVRIQSMQARISRVDRVLNELFRTCQVEQ
jgi:hypothetical protein